MVLLVQIIQPTQKNDEWEKEMELQYLRHLV